MRHVPLLIAPPSSGGASDRTAAYVSALQALSPALFWEALDTSGHFADGSGNSVPSTTESGTITYAVPTASPLGTAAYLSSGAISRAQVTAATNNVSLVIWLEPIGKSSGSQSICGNNNAGSNGYELITAAGTGGVKFALALQGIGTQTASTNVCLFNAWSMIAVVRDAGTWKYYFNGAVDNASVASTAPNAPSGGTTTVQRDAGGAMLWRLFSVHTTALSASNISTLYSALTG